MPEVFLGTDALSSGALSRGGLRWNYRAIYPNVYLPKTVPAALRLKAKAAWLWSGRGGVIAGRAAAEMHGARWVDVSAPVEMIWRNGRPPPGIVTRNERIADDEIVVIDGIAVTSAPRTALDLARHLTRDAAVRHLDALARSTGVQPVEAIGLVARYPKARWLRRSEVALGLMDAGAESPRETRLRLLLVDAGLPRPRTQIRVTDGVNNAYIDMGYDEPKVGLDYDGNHHSADRAQYVHDIGRAELVEDQGWIDIHVVAEHSRRFILHRVSQAFTRRGHPLTLHPRS